MFVKPYLDPAEYLRIAMPIYLRHEARNCVAIGVLHQLVHDPEKWLKFHLACVEQNGKTIAPFLVTPPHPLNLTDMPSEAIPLVADYVATLPERISGVLGSPETVRAFQQEWSAKTSAKIKSITEQGVFQLDEVKFNPNMPGHMALATHEHFDLLLQWNREFAVEADMDPAVHLANETRTADLALKSKTRYFWWIDGQPVSMAGAAGKTPSGIRIVWVYTPPHLRGKGYATKLVAELSQKCLNEGNRFCFLYTVLSNPTSNRIYQKIGYRRAGDSLHLGFTY